MSGYEDIIDAVRKLDPSLADDVAFALETEHLRGKVESSREELSATIGRFDQDNDDGFYDRQIDSAADDYIRAQDDLLKHTDPIQYAERQFGC